MENLLKSEGPQLYIDNMNNKHLAKISFLQQEVKQLQEYVGDLKYMLKLNKEAMRILLNTKSSNKNENDKTESNNSTNNFSNALNNNFAEQLFEENNRLTQNIEILIKERNIAQSKALINQQIAEEAESHSIRLENELEEKIVELKRIIQDKEYTIQDLEKSQPIELRDGNYMIIKEIMTPNEKILKLTTENEKLLKNLSDQIKLEYESKSKLEKAQENIRVLKQELIKIRFALTNPTNISRLRNYIVENVNSFSDEENIEFLHNYYNIREIKQQNQAEIKALIEKKRSLIIGSKKKEGMITAEKKKVTIRDKNMKEDYIHEINNLKKALETEALNNKLLLKDVNTLKKENEKICATNESLINSFQMLKNTIERLQIENTYYKEYFYKYIHTIKYKPNSSFIDLPSLQDRIKDFKAETAFNSKFMIREALKNEMDENSPTLNLKYNKRFLVQMAHTLNHHSNIKLDPNFLKICVQNNVNYSKPNNMKNLLRPKRCLSNPLLYINEGSRNLFQDPPVIKRKRFFKKKDVRKKTVNRPKMEIEKSLISPMPSVFDIKNGGNTPFLLDISRINPFNFEASFLE